MASYVESVLAPGERIVHRAVVSHWKFLLHYVIGALLIAAGAYVFFFVSSASAAPGMQILAATLAVAGVVLFLWAAVHRATTELALTDRRVITKRGLIARDTVEMNLGKVESLRVNQGLLGRILDYGDVTFVGTGSSPEPLRGIAQPLELRRKIGEVLQAPAAAERDAEIR